MKTDIERLHENIKQRKNPGNYFKRRTGKTFSRCHDVAGFLEIGHDMIFCAITVWRDLDYLIHMLNGVLEEHGLKMQKVLNDDNSIWVAFKIGCTKDNFMGTIRFVLEDDIEQSTRGYSDFILIPMGHND